MNILIMIKGEYSAPALGYCAGMYQPLGSMPKRSNSLRQAVLTHELKGSSPITELICSSKSSSNRIVRLVLLKRSYGFLSFSSCIGSNHYVSLCEYGANHFIGDNHKKQCPEVLETLTGHLTTNDNLSIEVAMYQNTTHPKGRNSHTLKSAVQSKNLSLAGSVLPASISEVAA